jgi:uncharacterized protein YjiS (DUF1127 family)
LSQNQKIQIIDPQSADNCRKQLEADPKQQTEESIMTNLNLSITNINKILNIKVKPGSFREKLSLWHERYKSRKQLAHLSTRMDDRLLSDIGISRIDAMQEYTKPFWKE